MLQAIPRPIFKANLTIPNGILTETFSFCSDFTRTFNIFPKNPFFSTGLSVSVPFTALISCSASVALILPSCNILMIRPISVVIFILLHFFLLVLLLPLPIFHYFQALLKHLHLIPLFPYVQKLQ